MYYIYHIREKDVSGGGNERNRKDLKSQKTSCKEMDCKEKF
jgi:hypothetical protein